LSAPANFRTCKLCNLVKEKSKFQPQGYQCRECRTLNEQKRRQENTSPLTEEQRQSRRNSAKEWREKNLEKSKFYARRTHIMRKFGLSMDEYNQMLKEQNGVCAICESVCATGNALAVDHNHSTGKIRKLLCKNCNTAIGLLKEDVVVIAKAIEYLKLHSLEIV
jgi:hypothetical protein